MRTQMSRLLLVFSLCYLLASAQNKTESSESQQEYELNEIKHAVTVLLDFAETLLEKPPQERMETLTNVTRFLLTQRRDDFS
ncbi:unnamed protein product [Schistocephalus solidus]|uniref:Secreted protein n=1 Tax=Schistocephalus solidus TaxID=70667 RepID=A0A183S8T1_SCHSO|nr:unnamed protein product [Schistocephalus solidus]